MHCRQAAEQTRTSEVLLTRLKGDVQVRGFLNLHIKHLALCCDLILTIRHCGVNLQVLNGYLESAKRHMEEEISSSGAAANAADPYSVQQTSQELPETQGQLSDVRERLKELVQQNSQVQLLCVTQTCASNCCQLLHKNSPDVV